MPLTAPSRNTMPPAVVAMMLTLLPGIQPITTDLYLPALPTLQRELSASVSATQLALSALIICFGFGQLLCGFLADRFGRCPVSLWAWTLVQRDGNAARVAHPVDLQSARPA